MLHNCFCIIHESVSQIRRRYHGATHEEACVKYSSAFPFSICHPNEDSFNVIYPYNSRAHTARAHIFSATFFIRVILLKKNDEKWKNGKKMKKNTQHVNANTLKSFATNTNVLKPHLWVCLVFYKVLAIFNLPCSILARPITHIILPIERVKVPIMR